jgi:hypothetical protein
VRYPAKISGVAESSPRARHQLWKALGKDMTELSHEVDVGPALEPADELEALRYEVEHLRRALSSRADIDQAKGVLMLRYGISAQRAFDVLVRWSQHANVKLRVVAVALLQAIGAEARQMDVPASLVAWLAEQLRGEAPGGSSDRPATS